MQQAEPENKMVQETVKVRDIVMSVVVVKLSLTISVYYLQVMYSDRYCAHPYSYYLNLRKNISRNVDLKGHISMTVLRKSVS